MLGGPANYSGHQNWASILKDKSSGASPILSDMESQQSSTIAAGVEHCVEVFDDGHRTVAAARGDESGTSCGGSGCTGRSRDSVRWSSKFSMKQVEPLLSTESGGSMAQFAGGSRDDERPSFARKLLKLRTGKPQQAVRNPYQRSHAVVFVTLGVMAGMSAYQEVVLGVGVSGCDREALFQGNGPCEGALQTFIARPMVLRQVGCALHDPPLSWDISLVGPLMRTAMHTSMYVFISPCVYPHHTHSPFHPQ